MKRFSTLLSLFLLFSISVFADDVAINATNFPDANFRAVVAESGIDKNQDGYLSQEEIEAIKELNVVKKSIADLKGIEYFTSVTQLYCSYNQLTSLDVSKNVALEIFWCYENQLTSLDLSKNTALKLLYCNDNQLTSLDLSKNTEMEYLECDHNQLTSLDVSKNTALKRFYCNSNKLTSLDVSKNTALNDFTCGDNKLTSLDVSKNTDLKYLHCDLNPLYSLDVSKNTALENLLCGNNKLTSLDVSNNTALKYLYCYTNGLTSLDVSKNTALKQLYCQNNKLTSLDVSNNTALETFYCNANQLTSLDVSKNTALKDLRCEDNQINEAEMGKLVESLPKVSNGEFRVKFLNKASEKNVITKAQVTTAKEKGWTVYAIEITDNLDFVPVVYDGDESDPSEPQSDMKKTTVDGREWTYTIVSESDKTCMLGGSATGDDGTVVYYPAIDVNTTGEISIPGTLDGYTVVTIGKEAFRGCKIEAVTIPAEVTYIDDNAFADCSNLVKVYCKGQPYDISETAFEGIYSQATAYYPEDCGEEFQSKKGWNKFTKWYEEEVEVLLYYHFRPMLNDLWNRINLVEKELVAKATESEAPELYEQLTEIKERFERCESIFAHFSEFGCVTVRDLKSPDVEMYELDARLQEFSNLVEQYVPKTLDPINNNENIDIGTEINTDTNLNGNVVGNILYNISSGNGEYDSENGCIVLNKPITDETMSNLEGKDIFGEDFKDQYTGIVLKVAEGKGNVMVEAETTGNMVLKVKIGNNDPIELELEGKMKMKVPYNVSEETLVYIYGSTKAALAKRSMKGVTNTESGSLKIFGIEITREGTGIHDTILDEGPQDVYSLSGQKIRSKAKDLKGLPAGVYIVGGKKSVVK